MRFGRRRKAATNTSGDGPVSKRRLLFLPLGVLAALAVAIVAFAGPVGIQSGFEDDDGNLVVNSTFDWNGFAPTTWTGTAPTRTATKTVNGWAFTGLEDAQATTSDSGFAGGTKQDDDCASVITAKAPNKDDLKRVYVASKTLADGDTILNLAWVRIPQNTTSPSAHIGFEFNQGSTACPAGSDGLVRRTAGDMLVVYDFEGGSTDVPTITLRRWLTDPDDPDQADFFTDPDSPCDVDSNSVPCWGDARNLTALGFAEAKVNTDGSVVDTNTPGNPSTSSTLGLNEFGEAGINLTDSGVFTPGECTAFGKTYAVSRSSGNSGTAQMKDLVGPGNINLQNCGTVKIIKQTDPRGLNQDFNYTSNIAGAELSCTADTTPASFTLNDNGNAGKTLGSTLPADNSAGNTEACVNVPAGSYTVSESATDPTGFVFDSLTCTSSGTGTSVTTSGRTASITMAGGGSVTCVYINKRQLGAIKVHKTRKHAADGAGDHPHAGVSFTVNGVTKQTDANGNACFDNLPFGTYTVHETVPAGYSLDAPGNDRSVQVDNNAACSDATYVGEGPVEFHNTPLTNLTVSVNSQVDGGTKSEIDCVDSATPTPNSVLDVSVAAAPPPPGANGDGGGTASDLRPGTYTCTVVIDP